MSEDTEEKKQSYILVAFAGENSTIMQMQLVNVSPAQVLAATAILEVKAKNAYIQQENERLEKEAQMNIGVPAKGIILPGH